jgi:hypothetical protein
MRIFSISVVVLLSILSTASSARAEGYICDINGQDAANIGTEISVGIWNNVLNFGGSDSDTSSMNGATGSPDPSYRPRANHARATRYLVSGDTCGTGDAVIVDKNMISTGHGLLTFVLDCDADGSGPTFQVYTCDAQ